MFFQLQRENQFYHGQYYSGQVALLLTIARAQELLRQGAPEPVHITEVRQRCDTQPVNSVTRRDRHPVAAESETPVLVSLVLKPRAA
jgi:hypothetical protein